MQRAPTAEMTGMSAATERIEGVRIARLRKTERGEGRLHPRGAIAQQIEILHCASSVADLHLDTIACKYSGVLPGEVVIPRPCHPGSDYKVTWRYRIDEAIDDV